MPALLAGISNTLRVRPVFRLVEGGNTGRVGLTRTAGGAIRQLERVAVDELGPAPQWLMVFHADAPDEAAELAERLTRRGAGGPLRDPRAEPDVRRPHGPGDDRFRRAAVAWRRTTGLTRAHGRAPFAPLRLPSVRGDGGSPSRRATLAGRAGSGRVGRCGAPAATQVGWRTCPLLFALGAIAALLVYADPHKIGIAFQRFNLVYIPIVVVLAVGFYLVQGVRWWTLNRALGIKFPLLDTVFLTETGQATALLPLGELTRALLLSKAAAVHLGAVVASETVQELLFVFMLFVLALPKALEPPSHRDRGDRADALRGGDRRDPHRRAVVCAGAAHHRTGAGAASASVPPSTSCTATRGCSSGMPTRIDTCR